MKRIFVPVLAAVGLLASDHAGVRPRGAAKDYPVYGSAEGFTIAASVVPAGKVKRQLSPDLVKAGYTVLEIAVYPDPGNGWECPAAARHGAGTQTEPKHELERVH